MAKSHPPAIIAVSAAAHDRAIRHSIAAIERLVQPHDPWQQHTIKALLQQDINSCWAVLNSGSSLKPPYLSLSPYLNLSAHTSLNRIYRYRQQWGRANSDKVRDKVIAYCLLSQVFDVGEILRIGTHPHFQRQGYAKCLLAFIITQMPSAGLQKILLEVRADNSGAIELYQQLGFINIHRRHGYYTSGAAKCDALVMQYSRVDSQS